MTTFAIISDSHDQLANLHSTVNYCNNANIDVLLHCGDLISPFMLNALTQFNGPVHLIYGSNIGDYRIISQRCREVHTNITHHGAFGSFCHDGIKIALTHYPQSAKELASQSVYDLVCCGHSHRREISVFGKTIRVNPGQLLGEDEAAGFIVLDFTAGTIQDIGVGECMFDRKTPIRAERQISFAEQVQTQGMVPKSSSR